jgi:hypothetical protein
MQTVAAKRVSPLAAFIAAHTASRDLSASALSLPRPAMSLVGILANANKPPPVVIVWHPFLSGRTHLIGNECGDLAPVQQVP